MKKTVTITLGKTVFYLEDDAYERLSVYLDAIRKRFAAHPDGSEILGDIENRAAEHFLEGKEGKDKIVTQVEVEALIASMGKPEDFTEDNEPVVSDLGDRSRRKLYRDTDNSILAGVASGIAAYFGMEPVIIRLAFFFATFLSGFGAVAYAVLWILMPEAKSPSEKLEMKGSPVTLETIDKIMRQTADTLKSDSGLRKALRNTAGAASSIFNFIFRTLGSLLFKVIGIILCTASVIGLFALIFAAATALFNVNSPYIDFPLREVVPGGLFYTAFFSALLVAIIPLFFVFGLGSLLAGKRNPRMGKWASGLLGIWFIAVIATGVSLTRVVPRYREAMASMPEYREVTRTYDVQNFSKIEAQNGVQVELVDGREFKVEASGSEKSLARLDMKVEDGTLHIERGADNDNRPCIFCVPPDTNIRITAPMYDSITGTDGARIESESLKASESLELTLNDGSWSDITLATSTAALSVRLHDGSRAYIRGSSETLNAELSDGSRLSAEDFFADDIIISARQGSRAEVSASGSLSVTTKDGSSVQYYGDPKLIVDQSGGSQARSRED